MIFRSAGATAARFQQAQELRQRRQRRVGRPVDGLPQACERCSRCALEQERDAKPFRRRLERFKERADRLNVVADVG